MNARALRSPALTTRIRAVDRHLAVLLGTLLMLAVGIPYVAANDLWLLVVSGVSDGSIYALAALGLVLTFKTSGIFNFAIGGVAATSAYVFSSFRIDLGLPWPIAAAITLVLVGLGGSLILERVAFLLAEVQPIYRVVATVGLLVLLQSALTAAYGQSTISFPPFLPEGGFDIGNVTIRTSQVIATGIALAAATGLYLFFRVARLGIAMQAVVEDSSLLSMQATSPVRVRQAAWAIGSCFVSISGMLLAPQLGLSVNQMLLLYIAAFGAAACGAFQNLLGTFVGAIAIGVGAALLGNEFAVSGSAFLQRANLQLPFVVLVIALLVTPKRYLAERAPQRAQKLAPIQAFPRFITAPGLVAGAVVAVAIPHVVDYDIGAYTIALGVAMVLASLALLIWTSGQISLCQMAFAAVGATTFAHMLQRGMPWLLALLVAGLVGMVSGAVAAIPSFRLSGTYLAAATFGFGLLLENVMYTTSLMFGATNSINVARPRLFGLDTDSDTGYYYLTLVIAVLCLSLVLLVRNSRLGRLLRALADSPPALQAHGTNANLTRVLVFCIAAFVAAIGGAMLTGPTLAASGDRSGVYGSFTSLVLVAVLAFCGRRPVLSPLLAAFFYAVLKVYEPFSKAEAVKYQGVAFGALALLVAIGPGLARQLRVNRRTGEREGRSRSAARRAAATKVAVS